MSKENNTLFSVNGFNVLENTTYRLRSKKDPSAPAEMQEMGYSKYPGTGTIARCNFNKDSSGGGVYDSGFDMSSRLYLKLSEAEKKKVVKERKDNVLDPFLNMKGLDNTRYKSSSFEDWDSFLVDLREDRVFNTSDYLHRMELYIALVTNSIVPPGANEYDYKYDGASFVLESSKVKTKKETENKKLKLKAAANFNSLLEKKKSSLIDILVYLGFDELSRTTGDEDVLISYLENKVQKSGEMTEMFNELAEKVTDQEGEAEVKVNKLIINAFKTKNTNFAKEGGKIFYKGSELGKTEKEAAKHLVENKNMANTLSEILFDLDK